MLELNKIYCLDVLEGLKLIDDECLSLVITSPPYNLHYKNGKYKKLSNSGGKWNNYALANGYSNYDDAKPHEEYVNWQKTVLKECWRCLKPNGAIFYNHKPIIRNGKVILPTEYLPPELNLRQIIIWQRAGGVNFNDSFYLPTYEWVLLICKSDFKLKSKGASGVKDVWTLTQDLQNNHPAPFPLSLPLTILETVKDNNLTLDPFCGSGTVPLACLQFSFLYHCVCNYIAFDIAPDYCQTTETRLKNYNNGFKQPNLF